LAERFVEWSEVLFDFFTMSFPRGANVFARFFGEVGEGGVKLLSVGAAKERDVFFEIEEFDAELIGSVCFLECDERFGSDEKRTCSENGKEGAEGHRIKLWRNLSQTRDSG
jgi:hypothetical protein